MYKKLLVSFFVLISVFALGFTLDTKASSLGPTYLFFEKMETNQQTEIILMFTPTKNFNPGTSLKLTFLNGVADWCENTVVMEAVGVNSSNVDISGWEIDSALPSIYGNFNVVCTPGDIVNGTFDSILVENINSLSSDVSYGIKILENINFKTSSEVGKKHILIEVLDSSSYQGILIPLSIVPQDTTQITTFVSNMSTISCQISQNSLNIGDLSESTYKTAQHTLTTTASSVGGVYWGVFGQGDGSQAGLWKSTAPVSLIPSTGNTTMNLSTGQGFGLFVFAPSGNVANNFIANSDGIFGAINSGYPNTKLIFYDNTLAINPLTLDVTIGARSGTTSEPGLYTEILTYLCGALY